MSFQIMYTGSISHWVKILCYGEAGIGKTTLCATAPNSIVISADKGLLSLKDANVPAIEVTTAKDTFDAVRWAGESHEAAAYESLCLDSVTSIAQTVLLDYKSKAKDPRQAYGQMADDMLGLLYWIRDNVQKHAFITAQCDKVLDPVSNILKYMADCPGTVLPKQLPYIFDELFALRIARDPETNSDYRYIQAQPDISFSAKDRSGKLDPVEYPHLGSLYQKILTT